MDGNPVYEYKTGAGGGFLTYNHYFQGRLVFTNTALASPTAQWIYTDHLGSPRLRANASGVETSRHWYYPYGEEFQPPANPVIFRYNAKERDAETGMQDYGARYYDTLMGRFTAVDPARDSVVVEIPQTWNRYVYTINSPTSRIDPDGRQQVIPTPEGPIPIPIPVTPMSSPATNQKYSLGSGPARLLYDVSKYLGDGLWKLVEPYVKDKPANSVAASKGNSLTIDDLITGSAPGRQTRSGDRETEQRFRTGGFDQANEDFDRLGLSDIQDKGNGIRVGKTADGKTVVVRPKRKEGSPTIEIQDGNQRTKIRYNEPEPHDQDGGSGSSLWWSSDSPRSRPRKNSELSNRICLGRFLCGIHANNR